MTQAESSIGTAQRHATPGRPNQLLRLKTRLQFTGWLQYLINAFVALASLLAAAAAFVLGAGATILAWLPAAIGVLALGVLAWDLVTVKLGLRPTETVPARLDDLDAFGLMRARRSCRSFQHRDLSAADRAALMESVRRNTRPDGLIGTRAVRFEYIAAPLTVWPVVGAHEFLVAIAPREYDRLAVIDVGRRLQHVVLDATRMGVATCWIGPGADQQSIVQHLGDRFDPEQDHVICVCAVGYRSRFVPMFVRFMQLGQHRRLPLRSLFFADLQLSEPLDVHRPPFDAFGRCYEVCQWSPSSFNGQPTRCAAVVDRAAGGARVVRFDFFAATASRFYAAVALGIWCANWETGCEALGIQGRFAVLSPEDRGIVGTSDLPRYDVSWLAEAA